MEQKSLLFIFSYATPQRTAYSEVPSQMAAHLRTAVHYRLGRLLDSNPGLQFYNLMLLPMSHHCSHKTFDGNVLEILTYSDTRKLKEDFYKIHVKCVEIKSSNCSLTFGINVSKTTLLTNYLGNRSGFSAVPGSNPSLLQAHGQLCNCSGLASEGRKRNEKHT